MHERRIRLNVKDFFRKCFMSQFARYYLFLHSYELIFVLVLAAWYTRSEIFIGLSIGMVSHIFIDTLHWIEGAYCYFLTYRIAVKFNGAKIFPQDYLYEKLKKK